MSVDKQLEAERRLVLRLISALTHRAQSASASSELRESDSVRQIDGHVEASPHDAGLPTQT